MREDTISLIRGNCYLQATNDFIKILHDSMESGLLSARQAMLLLEETNKIKGIREASQWAHSEEVVRNTVNN